MDELSPERFLLEALHVEDEASDAHDDEGEAAEESTASRRGPAGARRGLEIGRHQPGLYKVPGASYTAPVPPSFPEQQMDEHLERIEAEGTLRPAERTATGASR
jgi:hypothetical protein